MGWAGDTRLRKKLYQNEIQMSMWQDVGQHLSTHGKRSHFKLCVMMSIGAAKRRRSLNRR
jgi:hypothetical protein